MLRQLVLVIAAMIVAPPAFAQQGSNAAQDKPKADWIADAKNGCKVWNLYPQPNESITWSGDCRNGFAQGHGVLQWIEDGKPGTKVEADYRDGRKEGRGKV